MRYLSHDVLISQQTVPLSPFAAWRDPGHSGDSAKSAIRALQIMELLATSNRPLRAIEIVRALGLSPSSTNQLLKTMMDWGYLVFDYPSKRYYPSPRLSRLGGMVCSNYFGPYALGSLMQAAQEAFELPITILACQGTFMQIVDHLLTPNPSHYALERPRVTELGLHVPLFGSCSGAAWLSRQSEQTIGTAFRLCRRDLGPDSRDVGSILERLRHIKEQGYAFGGTSIDDRRRSVAVPLPATPNGIVLVMCVSGGRDKMEARREEIARVSNELVALLVKPK